MESNEVNDVDEVIDVMECGSSQVIALDLICGGLESINQSTASSNSWFQRVKQSRQVIIYKSNSLKTSAFSRVQSTVSFGSPQNGPRPRRASSSTI